MVEVGPITYKKNCREVNVYGVLQFIVLVIAICIGIAIFLSHSYIVVQWDSSITGTLPGNITVVTNYDNVAYFGLFTFYICYQADSVVVTTNPYCDGYGIGQLNSSSMNWAVSLTVLSVILLMIVSTFCGIFMVLRSISFSAPPFSQPVIGLTNLGLAIFAFIVSVLVITFYCSIAPKDLSTNQVILQYGAVDEGSYVQRFGSATVIVGILMAIYLIIVILGVIDCVILFLQWKSGKLIQRETTQYGVDVEESAPLR